MGETATQDQHHFFRGATVVASLTMLSRVFGLVRESAISALGATHMMGTFRVAFSIPNLFRRLFGEGAVSAAFVPIFTEVAEAEGWDKARIVLAGTSGLLAAVLASLVVIGEMALLAKLILAPGDADHTLLLKLTMIVLPFMLTVCLLALASAALNCKGHFAYPAFAPILLNIFMIAGAGAAHWLFDDDSPGGLFVLASSVTVAGVVQLVGVVWMLRRMHLAAVPRLRPLIEPVRRIVKLTLPMVLPIGVLQFSAFFDRIYAHFLSTRVGAETFELLGRRITKPLGEGVVTWFDNANRLYQFPMAILGISLATAMFPLFSRYAAAGDTAALRQSANRALRLSLFMGIPSGVALFLLAEPAMAVIFRHGKLVSADVIEASGMLQMYCLGMWAYFCNHILLRAFFAQKDTRTPLKVCCLLTGLNVLMVAGLVFTPLRARAIGLATATTATLTALTLAGVLHRRWGGLGLRRIFASLTKIAIASAALAAAILTARSHLLPAIERASNLQAGVCLLVCIPLGLVVYFALAAAMGCAELGELKAALAGRRGRAGGA